MDIGEVEKIIKTVGLAPSKSKYIVNLSKDLLAKFDGEVPNTYPELESLPGVGHKTASVVMNQIFGEPSIAVDTHVHRCSLRWGLSKEQTNLNKVQADLYKIFPQDQWSKLNMQMIYYGREYCTAKNHVNKECPICYHINQKTAIPLSPTAAPSVTDVSDVVSGKRKNPKKSNKGSISMDTDADSELVVGLNRPVNSNSTQTTHPPAPKLDLSPFSPKVCYTLSLLKLVG